MTCFEERRFSSTLARKPTLGRCEAGARPVVSPEEQKVLIDDVGKDRHSLWDFLGLYNRIVCEVQAVCLNFTHPLHQGKSTLKPQRHVRKSHLQSPSRLAQLYQSSRPSGYLKMKRLDKTFKRY